MKIAIALVILTFTISYSQLYAADSSYSYDRETYDLLAEIYLQLDQLDKAIEACNKSIRLQPDLAESHNNLGICLFLQGRFKEAAEEFQKAIQLNLNLNSKRSDFQVNLANALMKTGSASGAVSALKSAVELEPTNLQVRYVLCKILFFDLFKLDEALAQAKEMVRMSPKDPRGHQILAMIYAKGRKFSESESEFKTAIQLDPNDPTNHMELGELYYQQNMYSKAISELEGALKLNYDEAKAHFTLANAYFKINDSNRGEAHIKMFKRISDYNSQAAKMEGKIKDEPQNPELWYQLGLKHIEHGNLKISVEPLRQAIKLQPNRKDFHDKLAGVYIQLERIEEAKRECQAAILISPQSAESHNNLGICYFLTNSLAEAAASFKKATKLEPETADYRFNLARAYHKSGKIAEANEQHKVFEKLKNKREGR